MIELHKYQNNEEVVIDPASHYFTMKKLKQAFAYTDKGISMLEDIDPNRFLLIIM